MHYRYRETVYHIEIVQVPGEAAMTINGEPCTGATIPLVNDGHEHFVELRMDRSWQEPTPGQERGSSSEVQQCL
jgi:hypothetical protein